MVRTLGALDKNPRKKRSDSGKSRKIYSGKPCRHWNFKDHYGKDVEFTDRHKANSRRGSKKRHARNRDAENLKQRIRRKSNPENSKMLDKRDYQKIKNNPEKYLKLLVRNSFYSTFRKYIKKKKNLKSTQYGIDFSSIIESLKPFPKDLFDYHIDHIRPLASFNFIMDDGSINIGEIKKAYSPDNLQWLLAKENIVKGAKWNGMDYNGRNYG